MPSSLQELVDRVPRKQIHREHPARIAFVAHLGRCDDCCVAQMLCASSVRALMCSDGFNLMKVLRGAG